jgi:hypothetical protein
MINRRLKIRTMYDGSKVWADAKAKIGKGNIKCAFALNQDCLPNCSACHIEENNRNANLDNAICYRGQCLIIGVMDTGTV